ncbi:MAG TPA: CYTH and CHAD domain-containing protein [Gaiellaceae bacterium]|nr:CYTH and CHAD domain-containing protein [Gaiellaceae bacterium]
MKATLEREIKLQPPEGFELSGIDGARREPRLFDSTYYDTDDRRLARGGVTLRRRVESGAGAWQLKLPKGSARLELELEGSETIPDRATALLVGLTRRRPLVPVACLRTHRETVTVQQNGSVLADVVLDGVSVLEGERVAGGFEELEIELYDGSDDDLRRLEGVLRGAGAKDAASSSKLARVLGVEPPRRAKLASGASPVEALRAALRDQLSLILAHDPGTRLGTDAEDLHQLRVATRRLRAFLRASRSFVDEQWAEELRAELGWLGSELGRVRDLDVLIEHLQEESASLEPDEAKAFRPILTALGRERGRQRRTLLRGLESDRYLALLDRLETVDPPISEADTTLEAIWRREFRRLRRAMKELGESPVDDVLHGARIHAKRARYATELARPALGKRAVPFVEAAKELQDVLGIHQDAVVAEQVLRESVAAHPAAGLAVGRLIERERRRRVEMRRTYRGVWKQLDRVGRALEKSL